MRSTPVYEVHAVKYAHLPRKAWEVQINPDPHDGDFPMDYFVWVAIPLDDRVDVRTGDVNAREAGGRLVEQDGQIGAGDQHGLHAVAVL